MPPRRLDPRVIVDLCDAAEIKISEKVRSNVRYEMELMKNDMVTKFMRATTGMPRNMGTEDGHKEIVEDFGIVGSSDEDKINHMKRSMEYKIGWLDRSKAHLKLKHKMDVPNFLGNLNPEDMIDWIGELEDYFELEDI